MEHSGVFDLELADIGIAVEQGLEHGAGFLAVLAEDILGQNFRGALLAGERRLALGDVANEVEGIELIDAAFRQALCSGQTPAQFEAKIDFLDWTTNAANELSK